jgi:hypothetical protein
MGKKDEKTIPRLGKQSPPYRFFLNSYRDVRFSKCPQCSNKMGQRKLQLFIQIDPNQPLLLNKTCRYCPHCDLLIAHQDELDHLITRAGKALDPETVSSQYLVNGEVYVRHRTNLSYLLGKFASAIESPDGLLTAKPNPAILRRVLPCRVRKSPSCFNNHCLIIPHCQQDNSQWEQMLPYSRRTRRSRKTRTARVVVVGPR